MLVKVALALEKGGDMRERIARQIYTDWNRSLGLQWEDLSEFRKDSYREWVDECVLALIKEVGYVKLADDQLPPEIVTLKGWGNYEEGIMKGYRDDMLKAGWRRVELS